MLPEGEEYSTSGWYRCPHAHVAAGASWSRTAKKPHHAIAVNAGRPSCGQVETAGRLAVAVRSCYRKYRHSPGVGVSVTTPGDAGGAAAAAGAATGEAAGAAAAGHEDAGAAERRESSVLETIYRVGTGYGAQGAEATLELQRLLLRRTLLHPESRRRWVQTDAGAASPWADDCAIIVSIL